MNLNQFYAIKQAAGGGGGNANPGGDIVIDTRDVTLEPSVLDEIFDKVNNPAAAREAHRLPSNVMTNVTNARNMIDPKRVADMDEAVGKLKKFNIAFDKNNPKQLKTMSMGMRRGGRLGAYGLGGVGALGGAYLGHKINKALGLKSNFLKGLIMGTGALGLGAGGAWLGNRLGEAAGNHFMPTPDAEYKQMVFIPNDIVKSSSYIKSAAKVPNKISFQKITKEPGVVSHVLENAGYTVNGTNLPNSLEFISEAALPRDSAGVAWPNDANGNPITVNSLPGGKTKVHNTPTTVYFNPDGKVMHYSDGSILGSRIGAGIGMAGLGLGGLAAGNAIANAIGLKETDEELKNEDLTLKRLGRRLLQGTGAAAGLAGGYFGGKWMGGAIGHLASPQKGTPEKFYPVYDNSTPVDPKIINAKEISDFGFDKKFNRVSPDVTSLLGLGLGSGLGYVGGSTIGSLLANLAKTDEGKKKVRKWGKIIGTIGGGLGGTALTGGVLNRTKGTKPQVLTSKYVLNPLYNYFGFGNK